MKIWTVLLALFFTIIAAQAEQKVVVRTHAFGME